MDSSEVSASGAHRTAVDQTTWRADLAMFGMAAYTILTLACCASFVDDRTNEPMLIVTWGVARVVSIVLYCRWLSGAYKDNLALAGPPLRLTSGEAVASFFIPILSLFRPYQAVKELYEASDPEPLPDQPEYKLTPGADYRTAAGALVSSHDYRRSFPVQAWWGAFIVSSLNYRFGGRTEWAKASAAVLAVSTLVAAVLASQVIRAIVARQRERLRRLHPPPRQAAAQM